MSKRASFGSQFEKLRSLGTQRPLEEQKPPVVAKAAIRAPMGPTASDSSIVEECRSEMDSIQNGPCADLTVSKMDPVQDGQGAELTGSSADPLAGGFTRVQHSLLRGEAKFSEPLDFMIYMHLFTYSHGFGRREAHMSQAQLEKFTGATRNTIKRSLDRLTGQGWIKCVEEFERARMSRKWRVLTPEDRSGGSGRSGSGGKRTGAKSDSIQNGPSAEWTGGRSTVNPQTGSKIDPFLNRDPKEKTKNSLSAEMPAICEYLASVKPFGKRESERKAFQELRQDYSEKQVAACLEYLLEKGIPVSGATCHSPMGFLSKGMAQVWGEVQAMLDRRAKVEAGVRAKAAAEVRRCAEEEAAEQEVRKRELEFVRCFPSEDARVELVARFADQFPMLGRNGPLLKNLAISAWWNERALN
jgi:hypothetical protein